MCITYILTHSFGQNFHQSARFLGTLGDFTLKAGCSFDDVLRPLTMLSSGSLNLIFRTSRSDKIFELTWRILLFVCIYIRSRWENRVLAWIGKVIDSSLTIHGVRFMNVRIPLTLEDNVILITLCKPYLSSPYSPPPHTSIRNTRSSF